MRRWCRLGGRRFSFRCASEQQFHENLEAVASELYVGCCCFRPPERLPPHQRWPTVPTSSEHAIRPQFTLKSLFLLLSLTAPLTAAIAVEPKLVIGCWGFVLSAVVVLLSAAAVVPLDRALSTWPWWATLLATPALYLVVSLVFFATGEVADQGGLFILDVIHFPIMVALASPVLVFIDTCFQTKLPTDRAYYPRIQNASNVLSSFRSRWVMVIGVAILFGCYATTVVRVIIAEELQGRMVWPPLRIFVTCHLLWGVLWVVDCSSREDRGTIVAAVGYLLFVGLFFWPLGM